jgi:hypothetical protein
MALHAQNDDNKSFEALDVLIQACKVDPKNPQVRESKREREGGNLLCCVMPRYAGIVVCLSRLAK